MPSHPESLTHPSLAGSFPSTSTQSAWQPIELKAAHYEMIKKHVEGLSNSRIAAHLKRNGHRYSQRQIQRVLNSELGMGYASFYSAFHYGGLTKLVEAGTQHSPEALFTELMIMRNPLNEPRHRLNAGQDLLDRLGPPKISRQENDNIRPTTIVVNVLPSQMSQFLSAPPTVEAKVVPLLLENPSSNNAD